MQKVLAIDIGGTNVKFLAFGEKEARRFPSGITLTPSQMVEQLLAGVLPAVESTTPSTTG